MPRSRLMIVSLSLLALACSKKEDAKPTEPMTQSGDNTATKVGLDTGGKALGGEAVKLSGLKFGGSGFEGEFNEALDDWKFEKWEAQKDGTNENVVTIYVDGWNQDEWPTAVEEFATKLGEKDFLDFGSRWTKIETKTPYDGGWVITGQWSDDEDTEAAFAVRIDKLGALCRGTVKPTAKDAAKSMAEAIEACKGATI